MPAQTSSVSGRQRSGQNAISIVGGSPGTLRALRKFKGTASSGVATQIQFHLNAPIASDVVSSMMNITRVTELISIFACIRHWVTTPEADRLPVAVRNPSGGAGHRWQTAAITTGVR
jgi:hypothetical protein